MAKVKRRVKGGNQLKKKDNPKKAFTKTETNYYAVFSVTNKFDDEPVRKA